MKYGATPSNLLERVAFAAGRIPIPIVDSLCSIMKARVLMVAVDLGLFEALREGPATSAAVAERCGLDPPSTDLTLRTLVWAEYLTLSRGRFALTRMSRESLLAGARRELTGYVRWNYTQWKLVEGLDALLKTGQGADFHQTMTDPGEWRHYQQAMLELARFDAPWLAARVPVRPGAARLLDVGGSHGLFGALLCRRHPPLLSRVLDLASALPAARALAKREGITDVVEHTEGDALTSDLGSGQDVILLSNLLHHLTPEACRGLIERAFAAASPEGTIAIWELEAPSPEKKPDVGHGAALYFRLTSTSEAHSAEDYQGWLAAAGFTRVRTRRPLHSPGSILLVGRKPG